MAIEIMTLGEFDIKKSGKSIIGDDLKAKRKSELLKYFITYRGKKLLPEQITADLWADSESVDSKNALRTQIFRLRKTLKATGLTESNGGNSSCLNIAFRNGFYVLNIGKCCTLDFAVFEDCIRHADGIRDKNHDEAIQKYTRAIELYKGEYLPNITDGEWVYAIRNRYHRLYVQSVIRLFELLRIKGRNREIIEHFDQVMHCELYEEALHIFFLEALLDLGEHKNALSHYNYITGRMYRELGVKPSPVLKGIYNRITAGDSDLEGVDISTLSDSFARSDDLGGALFCELEYFRIIFNLGGRRGLRTRHNEYIGLVNIASNKHRVSKDTVKKASEVLKEVLRVSLRKGDVYTQWNTHQMIVLLTDTKKEALSLIGNRIERRFENKMTESNFSINVTFKPVIPDKEPFFV